MTLTGPITTTAPLPSLGQMLKAGLNTPPGDQTLFAPWAEGGMALAFSRASWALRAAVEAFSRAAGSRPMIWIPDYICAAPVAALRDLADIVFYPIDETLWPDWTACDAMAARRPPDIFLLVHYFGNPSDVVGARQFSDRHGCLLIEDAAHAFSPDPQIGRTGDAVLWSLYKHLPIPDGGLLVIRDGARMDTAGPLSGEAPAPPVGKWVLKRLAQRLFGRLIRRSAALPYETDPLDTTLPPDHAMSQLARRMIAVLGDGLPAIAERRRDNARALSAAFASASGLVPLIDRSGSSAVPYRVVLRGRDPAHAQLWYDRIVASGNVVESWPDLPSAIRQDPAQHKRALALRNTILALPIHADRTAQELCTAYLRAAESRGRR